MLLVITMLGILATFVVASYQPAAGDQLRGAAQVITSDVAYARSLAVANNSQYRLQFDDAQNLYRLDHSGANAQLEALPPSPFRDAGDGPNQQTTNLAELPALYGSVRLVAVHKLIGDTPQIATELEFGPLGALTQPNRMRIWLACGNGDSRRYLSIEIDPVTGLTAVGDLQIQAPSPLPAPAEPAQDPDSGEGSAQTGP
jgi:Tfp pilus assembly protein FimT